MAQDRSQKSSANTAISKKVAELLTRAYRAEGLTQAELAAIVEMSPITLQKKLAGNAPISINDLAVLAAAIPHTNAGEILERAISHLSVR